MLEFVLFLAFFSWSLFLGVNFFRMIEKHKYLYDDNVSLDDEIDAVYLEKF